MQVSKYLYFKNKGQIRFWTSELPVDNTENHKKIKLLYEGNFNKCS